MCSCNENSKLTQQTLDIIDYSLYDNFDASCQMVCGAKFVDSLDDIFKVQDKYNCKYNCFNIFFLIYESDMTNIQFSVYINKNLKEFYLRLDDIPNTKFKFEGKAFPCIYGEISFQNFDKDIENFCDKTLEPALKEYYRNTQWDMSKLKYKLAYVDHGDLEPIQYYGYGIKNIKKLSSILMIRKQLENLLPEKILQYYSTVYALHNTPLYMADSLRKQFKYVVDDKFLWSKNIYANNFLLEDKHNKSFIITENHIHSSAC